MLSCKSRSLQNKYEKHDISGYGRNLQQSVCFVKRRKAHFIHWHGTCSTGFCFCPSSLLFSCHFLSVRIDFCTTFHLCFCLCFYSHYFSDHICFLSFFLPFFLLPSFRPVFFFLFTIFPFLLLSLLPLVPFFYLFFSSIHTSFRVPFFLFIICFPFFTYQCFRFIPAASCYS